MILIYLLNKNTYNRSELNVASQKSLTHFDLSMQQQIVWAHDPFFFLKHLQKAF